MSLIRDNVPKIGTSKGPEKRWLSVRYGCWSGAQWCETLVNLSPWGSIFQRKTISTCYVFIFYNLNKNVSESKYSRHLESKRNSEIVKQNCFSLLSYFNGVSNLIATFYWAKAVLFFLLFQGLKWAMGLEAVQGWNVSQIKWSTG